MADSKKYSDIVDAAQRLFYKHGIRKVTVEEICAEAKVSKMTFYKYFPNKTEAAKAVYDRLFGNALKQFADLMESDLPFPEKMHGLLRMKIDSSKDADWSFVEDLYKGSYHELTGYITDYIQKGFKVTVDYLTDAQDKGFIRKDLSPTLMLVILDKIREMTFDERIIAAYGSVQDMAVEITKFFLYGICNER
ncbi:MAG: TetR/AcrR family transcriptional regulator [Prevotellaceae bacterium]|jgi:AcrR family transcriptional regulator|nr:TetR/AcrR family transcriptional regulator [Prevotellaceae bacterium]